MNYLRIAILGTRGIPNRYGGFEQAAEYLSVGLAKKGHRVTVYNSHRHPYKNKVYENVEIVHCFDPEFIIGTAGQFVYDLMCIRNASKKDFDIILFLGYTSSSVWWRFFPKHTVIVSNMDGMEWKRSKYNRFVQKFLRHAERLAAIHSHFLIADSKGIQEYLQQCRGRESQYIPYGAELYRHEEPAALEEFGLEPQQYYLLIARMEPENNIDMILEGFSGSGSTRKFLVIGDISNGFGRKMKNKYADHKGIRFAGSVYLQDKIHTIRKNAALYFHGHSVGGTNPSLLEAMASEILIVAHDNIFNRAILENDAFYFSNASEVSHLIHRNEKKAFPGEPVIRNYQKIKEIYNWKNVVDQYERFLTHCHESRNS